MRERAVIGTFLEGHANLPANLARLLAAAPHSFQNLTLGQLAHAVRGLRERDASVNPVTLLAAIGVQHPGALMLGQLPDEALPVDAAEDEAGKLVAAWRKRQALDTLRIAAEDLEREPEAACIVIRNAVDSLTELQAA